MIFHSIVPMDVVFGNNTEKTEEKKLEISYLGQKVEVTPQTNDRYRITRLISTSPQAYLNPKLQPGAVINVRIEGD